MRFKDKAELTFPEGQVTLIEGENGAGKTSILDALCICLYGKTLRTSGTADSGFLHLQDLVKHSSINADVEVEFENHGHNYLVTKRIGTGAKAQLFEDGVPKAVGANEVTEYVEQVAIGLDWEAFSKSSVILQGEMGALSQLRPTDRREMLKKLFGLERYDELARIAKEKADASEQLIGQLQSANAILEADIDKIPETQMQITKIKKNLVQLHIAKTKASIALQAANKTRDSLEVRSREYEILEQKAKNTETSIEEIVSAMDEGRAEVTRLKSIAANLPTLKKSYTEFLQLQKLLAKARPVKEKFDRLTSSLHTLSTLRNEKENQAVQAVSELSANEKNLKVLRSEVPNVSEVADVRKRHIDLDRKVKSAHGAIRQAQGKLEGLNLRQSEIESSVGKVRGQSICPVCLQEISEPEEVIDHYTKELGRNQRAIDECSGIIGVTTKQLKQLEYQFRQVNKEKQDVESRFGRKALIPGAVAQVARSKRRVAAAEKAGVEIGKKIEKINDQLGVLGFDPETFVRTETNLGLMQKKKTAERYSEAGKDAARLPVVVKKLSSDEKKKTAYEALLKAQNRRLAEFGNVRSTYQAAKLAADGVQSEFTTRERDVATEAANLKNAQVNLTDLEKKKEDHKANEARIKDRQRQGELFRILREAFRSIPEDVLRRIRPVIEAEGSEMVTNLSDNEISGINLEEESFTVSATTLGVKRPIEYYSGGQKTRINMALRVAISRILTKLPSTEEHTFGVMETLFIDEGDFGYLDEAGIRDIVESVRELTKVFSRVVIISHVETFRELFHGNAIRVVKTGDEASSLHSD